MKYYWVRIYDFKRDEELKAYTEENVWETFKGTLLDEYYLADETMTREQAKEIVKDRSMVTRFAKPRKNDGVYALIMDSTEYFYNRFCVELDDVCFNPDCKKHIKGKMKDFPTIVHDGKRYAFCSWDCYRKVQMDLKCPEGDWQTREDYTTNGIYGYIYHIYNRKTNMHYIGQTIYMPFFRWQEHAKSGIKGEITDLIFETVTEVRVKDQEYLNNIEAWWIQKYISDYGREHVINIAVPKLTMEDLVKEYERQVLGQIGLEICE